MLTTLRKVDDGYEVLVTSGKVIGYVHRAPDQAWSYAPWVIAGDFAESRGGVNGSAKRRRGFRTRSAAIREIEIMNSAAIIAAVQ